MLKNFQNWLFAICFSDECSFFVNGTFNRHNYRDWSDKNPHLFRKVHTQHPEKLNVQAGVVGPFFFPGDLTGKMYLQLLQNTVDLALTDSGVAHKDTGFESVRFVCGVSY